MIDQEIKKLFIKEVSKYGNIYASCIKIGIDKSTVYRWKNKSKKFKDELEKAIEIGRDNICDASENGLLHNIQNGDQRAIEYSLSHNSERYKKNDTTNVIMVHKKDFTPAVREPTLEEIIDVADRIFGEYKQDVEKIKEEKEEKATLNVYTPDENEPIKDTTIVKSNIVNTDVPLKEEPEKPKIETPRKPKPRDYFDRF